MSQHLEVMVIPFRQEHAVILPRNLVEYVLPYATPLPSDYVHSALVGSIIYQNEKVPVIDVDVLFSHKQRQLGISGRQRIIIVSCINEHAEFSSYAIIAEDAPHLLELNPSTMRETADEVKSPFYSRIEAGNLPQQQLYVLDLDALEKQIFE